MSNGIGVFMESLLSYPVLIASIVVIIISVTLLILKYKQMNKYMRIFIIALLIISLLITLFLVIMAIAFGNSHPPASPVPIS